MASITTNPAATDEVIVTIPADVLRDLDEVAERMGLRHSQLMTGAARRFLFSQRRWRATQASIAEQAHRAGLSTEDDIEDYLDSLPDDGR